MRVSFESAAVLLDCFLTGTQRQVGRRVSGEPYSLQFNSGQQRELLAVLWSVFVSVCGLVEPSECMRAPSQYVFVPCCFIPVDVFMFVTLV